MKELKACPFCGKEAYASEISTCENSMSGHYMWFSTCSECDTETDNFNTKSEAIEFWNNRPILATAKNLIEKYEKRLKIIEKTKIKCNIIFGVKETLTKKQNLINQFITDLKELEKCQE